MGILVCTNHNRRIDSNLRFLFFIQMCCQRVSGNISGLLFALILGYAIFSSVRFIRIHFHPVYQMGYSGHSVYDEGIKLPSK